MDLPPPLPPPRLVPLTVLSPHDCSYLPGREATMRAFRVDRMPAEVYHAFMDAGFRRSGKVLYQPVCAACRECVPIRVATDRFTPDKSQRRCARRNADLRIEVNRPVATDEKHALYARYIRDWHGRDEGAEAERDGRSAFESFLYDSPVDTIEFTYRDPAGRLLAVGIADVCSRSLSSVYFYFDPSDAERGLGTFGALREIDWARASGVPYYYLGYHVQGCRRMEYKSKFKPVELLGPVDGWAAVASQGVGIGTPVEFRNFREKSS